MIYIPSYKRANDCKAAKWLSQSAICCHEFEASEYAKYNENPLLIIPDKYAGKGMAVIRNYILDHTGEAEIVMIDDDVIRIGYHENRQKHTYTEHQVYDLIDKGFRMCKELDTVLWGLNLLEDKQAYREYTPFSLSSVVLGPFMGIVRNGIRFDERLGLKEDFDYSIQVLNKYRKILRFNKYFYSVGHLVGSGGCISYRTASKEMQQAQMLVDKWGSKIVKFKDGDVNPVVSVPIAGI